MDTAGALAFGSSMWSHIIDIEWQAVYFRSSGGYWDGSEMNEVFHDSWKSAYMQFMQIGVCIVALMGFVGVFICICVLRIW